MNEWQRMCQIKREDETAFAAFVSCGHNRIFAATLVNQFRSYKSILYLHLKIEFFPIPISVRKALTVIPIPLDTFYPSVCQVVTDAKATLYLRDYAILDLAYFDLIILNFLFSTYLSFPLRHG